MVRKCAVATLVGFLATGFVGVFLMVPPSARLLEGLEHNAWDWRSRLLATSGHSAVRLILLDKSSLQWGKREYELGWPWPREAYVPIIDFCRRAGAKVLAFDIQFSEPSTYSAQDDEVLGRAAASFSRFVLATLPSGDSGNTLTWPADTQPSPFAWRDDGGSRASTRTEEFADFPVAALRTNVSFFGHVLGVADRDGVIRRVAPLITFDGHLLPVLGLAAYAAARAEATGKGEWTLPAFRAEGRRLEFGDVTLPLDEGGRVVLRFRSSGAERAYRAYPAAAILESEILLAEGKEPRIDPEELRGTYVLFGLSAPNLDDWNTPVRAVSPGVEIHATFLDNLLSHAAIAVVPRGGALVFGLILAIAASMWVRWIRSTIGLWLGAAALSSVPLGASLTAYLAGYWWRLVEPQLILTLALGTAITVNYATEGRQRRFIKRAFQHYLSPVVIESLLSNPAQLKLGGERRELSIFFSDLQGFSGISEHLEPEELTSLLNEYLSDMTEIILDEGGTLDKYEGDAIIAFWNAPLDQEDHALRACRAALRCQAKLAARRSDFAARFGAVLHMRIGVHTGPVVVGNLGSRERFDYTVLGDAANLAARLEGANKRFGTYLMVSEATWSAARQHAPDLVGRPIGRLRVVGRKSPVSVIEPLSLSGSTPEAAVDGFRHAASLCEEGRWGEALSRFRSLPDDPLVATYRERLQRIVDGEIGEWDGIWSLTEK